MIEYTFSEDEIKDYISENIIEAYQPKIYAALLSTEGDRYIDEIGYFLAGGRKAPGYTISTGVLRTGKAALWESVKKQIYSMICTDSVDYVEIREKSKRGFKVFAGAVSAYIAGLLGVGVGVVAGLVALVLISVWKLGKNAWCEIQAQGHI